MLQGKPREALKAMLGNRRVFVALGEAINVARHDLFTAFLSIQRLRHRRAQLILDTATASVRAGWPLREQGIWHEYYGELELSRGNLAAAHQQLDAAIAIGEQSGPDQSLIGQSRRLRAQVQLAEGRLREAWAECERALTAIGIVGERIEDGIVRRVQAQIHAQEGRSSDARASFAESAAKLRLIGANLELARTLLEAGECAAFSDRERLAHLLEADRLFSEIGVGDWIERAHAALARTRRATALAAHDASHDRVAAEFVTANPDMQDTLRLARAWASSNMAVLITGETGTGKDLLAKLIHHMSPRCGGPFVDIDLSTLPESLWESELFGHKKGTFTGAAGDKTGLLESAEGGTVFLNEIGNLSAALQAKLLEFLDTHEIRHVGSHARVRLNVRLVAATNCDLVEAVEGGRFRADLYYRLSEAHVHLSPLRERPDDIPLLLRHFLALNGANGTSLQQFESLPWVERARHHAWTGNGRELSAFVHRLVTLAGVDSRAEWERWADELLDHLERVDRRQRAEDEHRRLKLVRTLERNDWNQRAAARDLGLSEGGVRHLMRRWTIERPQE